MNARSRRNAIRPTVSAAIYVVLVGAFVTAVAFAAASVLERRATVNAASNMLAQLEGRGPAAGITGGPPLGGAPAGSPFLEGQTVTVAGAALLQRVAGAVNRLGGNVLSSQVDLQKADAKDGWVGLLVSCEVEQPAVQQLLYDLEAGMPFLFIDQLVVTPPVAGVEEGRMRVLISVAGLWGGGK